MTTERFVPPAVRMDLRNIIRVEAANDGVIAVTLLNGSELVDVTVSEIGPDWVTIRTMDTSCLYLVPLAAIAFLTLRRQP